MFIRTGFGIGVVREIAPFWILASAPGLRTRYQTGDACEVPACGTADAFQDREDLTARIRPLPPSLSPGDSSCWPSHSTYSAQPLVTYLKRGSYAGVTRASAQAYAFRCWICARMPKLRGIKRVSLHPIGGHAHTAEVVLVQGHRRAGKGKVPGLQAGLRKGDVTAHTLCLSFREIEGDDIQNALRYIRNFWLSGRISSAPPWPQPCP